MTVAMTIQQATSTAALTTMETSPSDASPPPGRKTVMAVVIPLDAELVHLMLDRSGPSGPAPAPAPASSQDPHQADTASSTDGVRPPILELLVYDELRSKRKLWKDDALVWYSGRNMMLQEPVDGAEYVPVDPNTQHDLQVFIHPDDYADRPTHFIAPEGYEIELAVASYKIDLEPVEDD